MSDDNRLAPDPLGLRAGNRLRAISIFFVNGPSTPDALECVARTEMDRFLDSVYPMLGIVGQPNCAKAAGPWAAISTNGKMDPAKVSAVATELRLKASGDAVTLLPLMKSQTEIGAVALFVVSGTTPVSNPVSDSRSTPRKDDRVASSKQDASSGIERAFDGLIPNACGNRFTRHVIDSLSQSEIDTICTVLGYEKPSECDNPSKLFAQMAREQGGLPCLSCGAEGRRTVRGSETSSFGYVDACEECRGTGWTVNPAWLSIMTDKLTELKDIAAKEDAARQKADTRRALHQCINCGRPLGFLKRFSGADRHEECRGDFCMMDRFPVAKNDRITVRIERIDSDWKQGLKIATGGSFRVNGKHFQGGIVLWSDTVPPEVAIDVSSSEGNIQIRNVWDTGDGVTQSLHNGAGMLVDQVSESRRRYRCNDGRPDEDFNDIIFTVERTNCEPAGAGDA